MDFFGKTVLVTGSTQNLGYSVARAFADSRARVILHGITDSEVMAAAERLRQEILGNADIHAIAFDLGKENEIRQGFAALAEKGLQPHILVNNAAHLGLGDSAFLQQTSDFFREVLEVNLFATFSCSQLAAPFMEAQGSGVIINISSLAGERSVWGRSAYCASKAAVDGLTRSMALELAECGIRVNAIVPGYIWTPRWDGLTAETELRRRKNAPIGGPTQQQEIADLVLFLASEKAPSLIGSRLVIDGGLNAQQIARDASV